MRRNLFGLIAAISLGAAVSAAQKPEDAGTTPARGDTIVVRGCVSGSLLKDLRQQKTEVLSGAETAVVYRLAGDKKLLQQIQKEHQNQVLDVTGILPPREAVPARRAARSSARRACSWAPANRPRRNHSSRQRIQFFASHLSNSSVRAVSRDHLIGR